MKNLKINLASNTSIGETTSIEGIIAVPEKDSTYIATSNVTNNVVKQTVCETFEDSVPSNWIITPTETGIVATNAKTLEKFEGTIQEFNKRLKG